MNVHEPTATFSLAERMARLPPALRKRIVDGVSGDDARRLRKAWRLWARPAQVEPPGDWDTWVLLAGRGFGKTRVGSEWVREQVEQGARYIALVAPTASDARDTMTEKVSGILKTADPAFAPTYEPSRRLITWPNGAMATLFSAEEPERLRGPEHDRAWLDEFGAYGRNAQTCWDMLSLGLRLGRHPRVLVTTTGRPLPTLREIVNDPRTVVTRGQTSDNRANLADSFLRKVLGKYEGTRLGAQELRGDILDDNPGALFQASLIEAGRVAAAPDLRRIVVSVDPAITARKGSDLTGIIVAGLGFDGRIYVLADLSGKHTPEAWRAIVVGAHQRWEADCVVAEQNRGGDLVASNLRTAGRTLRIKEVHARRGKATRAEPVAALYEQGRVSHVLGARLELLEREMTGWDPAMTDSPDRVDALVWAVWELAQLGDGPGPADDYASLTVPSRLAQRATSADLRDFADEADESDDDRPASRW